MEKRSMLKALETFIAFLMVGCGLSAPPARPFPTPVPSPTHSIASDPNGLETPSRYYPLREGASYVYRHSENGLVLGTLTIAFHEVSQVDGRITARADRSLDVLSGPQPVRSDRVILSNESIDFAYYLDNGDVYNRFSLPLKAGRKWTFPAPDGVHNLTVQEIVEAQAPLRNFKDCVHIYEKAENNLVLSECDYWLAPDVGLVRFRYRQTIQGEKAPYVEVVDELSSFS
ncbi:MAG TPA: hypothetical protein DD435_14360 [Cyanobacteria bacterium UBA8530]|nr:hypothetical protein [Cyanobacteria bacterium UBA8530]